MRKNFAIVLLLIFIGGLFILIFQNWDEVFINFLSFKGNVPLALIILVSAGVGAFIFRLIWRILKWGLKNPVIKAPSTEEVEPK